MKNSIEENIKEIECFFKRNYFVNSDWTIIHRNSMANLEDSIEDILSDYKRVLKENEELKKFIIEGITIESNSPYKNYQLDFLRENFVSKKKIKDKIEELKINLVNMQGEELLIYESKIEALQELLEKE